MSLVAIIGLTLLLLLLIEKGLDRIERFVKACQ